VADSQFGQGEVEIQEKRARGGRKRRQPLAKTQYVGD